ncbi:MAG: serine/threonine protein kinase [Polyangiales bacterium]
MPLTSPPEIAPPPPPPPPPVISSAPVHTPMHVSQVGLEAPKSGQHSTTNDRSKVCPKCMGRYPTEFNVCPKDATPLEIAQDDGDPILGAVLGSTYQVKRVLGEGGMGKVYEAAHTRLGSRRFAVKVLHAEYARHNDVLSRFQREAEAAASINHTHVLEVFDVSRTDDGRPYIVSEFLEGEDFHEYLERVRRIDIATAVGVTRQIAGALKAAHDAGIVHRDLKPENVYVVQNRSLMGRRAGPFVKILDFGISKVQGKDTNLTRTGMIMGTPNYMAPEQARGEKVDHRVDVYALGAMLYRMVTGKRAFEGTDAGAVITAVLNDDPRRPRDIEPSIPEALEVVIQRAMAKDKSERYQSMEELDRDLAVFDSGSGVPSIPPPGPAVTVMPEGLKTDATARTFIGDGSPAPAQTAVVARPRREMEEQLASKGREAKLARPTIVVLTFVSLSWLFGIIVAAAAGVIRGMQKDQPDLRDSELLLIVVFTAALMVTPLIVWVVHIVKHVWRNSVRASELASDMRRFLAGSMMGYGFAAIAIRFGYEVIAREAKTVGSGWWDLAFLFFAVMGGAFGGGIGPLARLRRRLLNA